MSDPIGKIVDKDGKDVSARDRTGDGTIVVRRGLEKGHNYKFGQMPPMPWHMAECPKCEGHGTMESLHTWLRCDLCYGEGEVRYFRAKKYIKDNTNDGSTSRTSPRL